MAFQTLDNVTGTDIGGLLSFPNLDNPLFYPIILLVVFVVYTSRIYFKDKSNNPNASMLPALAVGGFLTLGVGVAMFLLNGLIGNVTLITLVVIVIIFIALLFTRSKTV